MVRVICPKCGRKGSLNPVDKEGKYWRVTHKGSNDDRCYLGSSPGKVKVLEDHVVTKEI